MGNRIYVLLHTGNTKEPSSFLHSLRRRGCSALPHLTPFERAQESVVRNVAIHPTDDPASVDERRSAAHDRRVGNEADPRHDSVSNKPLHGEDAVLFAAEL